MADRHEQADQVAIVLQRTYPEGVTQDELISQSGLTTDELRGAIASLEEGGEVERDGDKWRFRDRDDADVVGPDEPDPDPPDTPTPPEFDEQPMAPPVGATNRVILEVVATFPASRGASERATLAQATAIAEEVQNVLGTAMGNLDATVYVRRLEVFDEPRVLYDVEDGKDPPE